MARQFVLRFREENKGCFDLFLVMQDNRAQNPPPSSWTHQLPDQLSHIHKQERLFNVKQFRTKLPVLYTQLCYTHSYGIDFWKSFGTFPSSKCLEVTV